MTSIAPPPGTHLPPLEVTDYNKRVRELTHDLRGKYTLLYLCTTSSGTELFNDVARMWSQHLPDEAQYGAFMVSITLDAVWSSPGLGRYIREGSKHEVNQAEWDRRSTLALQTEDMNSWLDDARIPRKFRRGSSMVDTMEYAIALLVGPELEISQCILGLSDLKKEQESRALTALIASVPVAKHTVMPSREAGIGSHPE